MPSSVNIQGADQQSVNLVKNQENGREEAGGVLEVGVESGIAEEGWLLWVAASEKVKEGDAEGLTIIDQGRIGAIVGKWSAVAFQTMGLF